MTGRLQLDPATRKEWIKQGKLSILMSPKSSSTNFPPAETQEQIIRSYCLVGATLERADLRGKNLDNVNLTGASLRGCDLSGSSLRGAILVGADLSRACLHLCDFDGARTDGLQNIRWATFRWFLSPLGGRPSYIPFPGCEVLEESAMGRYTRQENAGRVSRNMREKT